VICSIYNENEGTKFPKGPALVQTKQYNKYIQIYNVWQPSLVLGRPARARNGPYSLQRLYTDLLALQAY